MKNNKNQNYLWVVQAKSLFSKNTKWSPVFNFSHGKYHTYMSYGIFRNRKTAREAAKWMENTNQYNYPHLSVIYRVKKYQESK